MTVASGGVDVRVSPRDQIIAKASAGRPKDGAFCQALLAAGLVEGDTLRSRIDGVPRALAAEIERARAWIGTMSGSVAGR